MTDQWVYWRLACHIGVAGAWYTEVCISLQVPQLESFGVELELSGMSLEEGVMYCARELRRVARV